MVVIFGKFAAILFFSYFDDFAAFVFAAVRAYPMRELRLMAIRALGHTGAAQRIVCAARRGPPFGMSSFWIRHLDSGLW